MSFNVSDNSWRVFSLMCPARAPFTPKESLEAAILKWTLIEKKSSRFGLNIADVQQVVSSAIGGVNITQTVEDLERYPVNIRYPQSYRDSPEQLALLPVVTPTGQRIALGDVANIFIEDGPAAIKSENSRINGWVLVDIESTDVGSYVDRAMTAVNDELELPAGYSISWSGQYEYMLRAKEKLTYVVPLTFVIIALLLFLNFQRFAEVALILLTLLSPWSAASG